MATDTPPAAAAGSGAGASLPAPRPAHLMDLPDELLGLITNAVVKRWPAHARDYMALLGACRRLRDVGYAFIRSASFRASSEEEETAWDMSDEAFTSNLLSSPVELLRSPRGEAMAHNLRSAIAFVRRARQLREVTLHACTYDGGYVPDPNMADASVLYYTLLLPELRRLPLTSFSASLVAVPLLEGPPLSVAPLRRLCLDYLEEDPTFYAAVRSVLGHHGGTLEELELGGIHREPSEPSAYKIAPWLLASGGMPHLRSLTLGLDVDAAAATAVADLCPALTQLTVVSKSHPGACTALRLPALPALSHLTWAGGKAVPPSAGVDLEAMLAGRTFVQLELSRMATAEVLPAVVAAAALPPEFRLACTRGLRNPDLRLLLDGPATALQSVRKLHVHLDAAATWEGLRLLDQLAGLTDLIVQFGRDYGRCPDSPSPNDLLSPLRLAAWPVGGLHHLSVLLSMGYGRARRQWMVDLLRGLAASGSRDTLQCLSMSGPELTEADAAAPLAALPRLSRWNYHLESPRGVFVDAPEMVAACARMAKWLTARLPAVRHPLGLPRGIKRPAPA